jgi:hypothetical protein
MGYLSSLLQEWIREGFRHECAQQVAEILFFPLSKILLMRDANILLGVITYTNHIVSNLSGVYQIL